MSSAVSCDATPLEPFGSNVSADDRRRRFEAVFVEVYEPVQRYVRRRAPAADVDDVVADALLVVWRRLDDVPGDAPLPWTYAVARRCLANHRRSRQRADRLVSKVVAAPPPPAVNETDGDPQLDAALAAISDDDRELLRLWAWEQLVAGEIATVLGISANATSIRLHRAKRRLAAQLGDAGNAGEGGGHSITGRAALADGEEERR